MNAVRKAELSKLGRSLAVMATIRDLDEKNKVTPAPPYGSDVCERIEHGTQRRLGPRIAMLADGPTARKATGRLLAELAASGLVTLNRAAGLNVTHCRLTEEGVAFLAKMEAML